MENTYIIGHQGNLNSNLDRHIYQEDQHLDPDNNKFWQGRLWSFMVTKGRSTQLWKTFLQLQTNVTYPCDLAIVHCSTNPNEIHACTHMHTQTHTHIYTHRHVHTHVPTHTNPAHMRQGNLSLQLTKQVSNEHALEWVSG